MRLFFRKNKKIIYGIICFIVLVLLIYLGSKSTGMKINHVKSSVYAGNAFGTNLKKTLYNEDLSVLDDINRDIDKCLLNLENQLSVNVPTSDISKCNYNHSIGGKYELPENMVSYIKEELEIFQSSGGAYSPCMRPLAGLWGIEDGETEVPSENDVKKRLKKTDASNVEVYETGVIIKGEDMMLDFGATGKGIACDEVRKLLKKSKISGGVVSIGGSICVYGDKGDGKDWHIGIQDPRAETGEVFAVIDVPGTVTVSTSGDYEKYFEKDGVRYHHIFDPKTGYPANNGLISVTIVCEDGLMSDALSTACFVMGLEDGLAYAEKMGVDGVFVTSDKEVYTTKNLKKKIRLQSEKYTLCKLENK